MADDQRLTSLFKPIPDGFWHSLLQRPGNKSGGENKALTKVLGRRTATSGITPAGSGRALRLDPTSLPLSFEAIDPRADGSVRHIELHRERVILRRELHGMRMAIKISVSDFLGVAVRGIDDSKMLVLVHRDPALSIPLGVTSDDATIQSAWDMWSATFALPQLPDEVTREPAQRRRRRNAIRDRRPKFLVRRRVGHLLNAPARYAGSREIIARN